MARTYKRDSAGRFASSGGGVKGALSRNKKNRGIKKNARKRAAVQAKSDRVKRKAYKAKSRVVAKKRQAKDKAAGKTWRQNLGANLKRTSAARKKNRARHRRVVQGK